ncbi:MAG: hypothetical protein IPP76_13390 [Moraxellaceae bacterium]|nr:hypothetical protein [Moraxellaceae bacterium]
MVFDYQGNREGRQRTCVFRGLARAFGGDDYVGYKALFEAQTRRASDCERKWAKWAHIRRKFLRCMLKPNTR